MAILFENCPVTIDGTGVYATSASLDQSIGTENLKVLGVSNISVVGNEAPKGTFSAEFIIHDDQLINKMTGFKNDNSYFTCVAGPFTATNCLFTSFSLSAEPNNIITANFGADILGEITTGVAPAGSTEEVTGAHTSTMTSNFSTVGYANQTFSFSYDLTQSYNLIYSLTGGFTPALKEVSDGEESVSVEGDNIAIALTGVNGIVCLDKIGDISLSFDDGCGNGRGSLTINGYINSRDVSIADNDLVRGTASITNPF